MSRPRVFSPRDFFVAAPLMWRDLNPLVACQDAEANAVAFEPFGADAKLREAETIDFRDPVQLSKDVIVQASWGAGMPTLGRVVVVVVRSWTGNL